MPYLLKGNGICKLFGLQWSVGAEKKWLAKGDFLNSSGNYENTGGYYSVKVLHSKPVKGRLESLSWFFWAFSDYYDCLRVKQARQSWKQKAQIELHINMCLYTCTPARAHTHLHHSMRIMKSTLMLTRPVWLMVQVNIFPLWTQDKVIAKTLTTTIHQVLLLLWAV